MAITRKQVKTPNIKPSKGERKVKDKKVGFSFDTELDLDDDVVVVKESKSRNVKCNLTKILEALYTKLDEDVDPSVILKAIKLAGSETVNTVKESKEKKEKKETVSSGEQFEKVTREFGYALKDGKVDPSELKEKFKHNMERAKTDFPKLKISCFNKIVHDKKQSGIVSGIRKAGGEWVFMCIDSKGKKFNVPVSNFL